MTAMRLANGFQRGDPVSFDVEGMRVSGHRGETLAAALMAAGILRLRHSPREGGGRGAFCFMGVCQECVLQVDGVLRQSCQVTVAEGMNVILKGPV